MRTLFIISLLCLLILNAVMYSLQPQLVFFPHSDIDTNPNAWGMQYSNIELKTEDNLKLHGWFIPAKNKSKKVILFCHGNAGNISHRGLSLKIFHELGLNVLIFDYRGYGKSKGSPHEQGLYKDVNAAWTYLRKEKGYKKENIIIFGRSLGGAVAMWLALKVQAPSLILESTFNSFRGIASAHSPYLTPFIIARYNFNTESRVSKFKGKLLVIHSSQDDIIPYALSKKIFASAAGPKTFLTIRGGHNDAIHKSLTAYNKGLKKFIYNHN